MCSRTTGGFLFFLVVFASSFVFLSDVLLWGLGWLVHIIALPVRRWVCFFSAFSWFTREAPKGRETRGEGEVSILSCLYCFAIWLSDACIINTLDLLLCFQEANHEISLT